MRNALLILIVAVMAAGCHTKQTPSASDTVLRSAYADGRTDGTADTVNGSADNMAAQGLENRETNFSSIDPANLERGVLPSIYFDFDKATIKASERAQLTQAAEYLKTNSSRKVLLEGHCDWKGTAEYNLGLGDRRAKAVKNFLGELGIESSRIGTVSKGDLEAVNNATAEQSANDRRVDLLLLKQ